MFQRCKFPVHLKKAGEKGERPYVWVVLQYFFEGLILSKFPICPLLLCVVSRHGVVPVCTKGITFRLN